MKFEKLLSPGRIGTMELKNRIVLPPMGTMFCSESGEVTDTLINWHARRAKGGAALLIVEGACAATAVDPMRVHARQLRIDDTSFIPGFERLAEAIHTNGARAALQLSPGFGAQAVDGEPWLPGSHPQPVSPSGVPAVGKEKHPIQPRVLSVEEIRKIVQLCASAAQNVKHAGFDMIEIHAHGGYLLTEFLSPYFNRRTDEYGGSLDNRCRFLLEIVGAVRKAVGPDFALTVKYSIRDFLPGGWDVKQSQALAKKLEAAGVDGIGISSGVYGVKMAAVPPYFYPRGVFIPFAVAIKEAAGIPVYVGGRLDAPRLAEKVLREGKADFICLGRGLIADPDWPQKMPGGRTEEIRPCLACNECRHTLHKEPPEPVRCAVNAVAGLEGELEFLKPPSVKKKVLIMGGGPAGMEAARVAAMRGHEVLLCERRRQLGGLMLLAGVANEQVTSFARWLISQVENLPVEVRLKCEVTPAIVEELKPDVVILAGGGTFVTPAVPGINRNNVLGARDLLAVMNGIPVHKGFLLSMVSRLANRLVTAPTVSRLLKSNLLVKKRVAIIGGQFPGCSLALFLAHKGKKVTILEESDKLGKDMEAHTMVGLKNEIEKGNVKVLTSVKIDEITEKGVAVVDRDGNKSLCEADNIIVALELAPSDSNLASELRGKVREVYTIGDAKSFRRIIKAISEGYVTACNL
ncbi:MAG: FAD-dependent oxidoreductase [Chloroflexi bacterium]|nr:FAD-dependent oxidoreductase [Chloroflexota bacterium]